MQIFGHFEGFPLKSVMVWVGSTMTPVERAELLWPKHKFKIRWSEKIRKHGWILWCIYVWLHDLRWLKFSNALLIYVVHYSEPDTWEYIGMYWNISNYDIEIRSVKNERENKTQKQSKPSSICIDTLWQQFSFFQGGWPRKWSWYQRHFTVFLGRTWEILRGFVSVFFLKHFFCNKNNSQQSYFDTSPGWWMHHERWLCKRWLCIYIYIYMSNGQNKRRPI